MRTHTLILSTLLTLLGFLVFSPYPTHAMVVRGGETYSLEEYKILEDDLYVAGNTLTIAGTTTGDIIGAGSTVTLSGQVAEDVLVVGGTVALSGLVEGDARIIGGKVTVSGHVTEDLILIGGTLVITESAVIEGDVLVVGEYFESKGNIGGIVETYVRTADISGGTIGGSLRAVSKDTLSVTGDAYIQGDLEYTAPHEALVSETATVDGERKFTQSELPGSGSGSIDLMKALELLVITVVASVALSFFFPVGTRSLVDTAFSQGNIMHAIKGFLLLLAIPIAALLLLITLLGVVPSLVLFFSYVTAVLVATALAPILAGVIIARWFKKQDEELTLSWVSFGAIMFTLVSIVPILGFLARTILFFLAFYAVCVMAYEQVWLQRKGAPKNSSNLQTQHGNEKTETESIQETTEGGDQG